MSYIYYVDLTNMESNTVEFSILWFFLIYYDFLKIQLK